MPNIVDENVKSTYNIILSRLYNAMNLIEEEEGSTVAYDQISYSIDLISSLMYSDPRC